jgi:hypothetical protein
MDDVQQLLVSLEGRFSQYERNFDRAMRKTDTNFRAMEKRAKDAATKMDGVMSSAIKGLGAGIAGAIAGIGFQEVVQRVADTAKSIAKIGDEAKRAGLSSRAFQELGYVASQNRIEVDALTDGMKELSLRADEWITTGGGSAAEAFQRLGFSAAELKTKLADPSALLAEIIDRVKTLDRAAQIRIFDEIFGGTGGEKFVQLIDRGADSIRKTVKEARDLGLVLDDEVIAKADEIDRKFDQIATTVSTKLKSAVVTVVSEMAEMSKSLNGTKEQAVALAGNRLLQTYAEIEEAKEKLDALYSEKAAYPEDVMIDVNIERAKEDLEYLKKQALEIRDIMDRYQGYPGDEIKDTGDKSSETKPKVDGLNNALSNSSTSAKAAATGFQTAADAIRALRNEVPALASELATLDARTRINSTYQAALSKARTVGETYQAAEFRSQALQALDIKTAGDDPSKFLAPYLAAGKTPMSLTGMESQFSENLAKMFAAAPAEIRASTTINSGYRSIERQQQLWVEALAKYGSPEAARKWVAPPGNSQHNKGFAADLGFQSDAARQWFHANASQYGLTFPMGHEPWHIEDAGARQNLNTQDFERRAADMQQQSDAYKEIISGSKEFIRSQQTEGQALGMTAQQAATYRREQEMLAQAQARGIPLTDEQRRQIHQYAVAMGQAEAETDKLKEKQQAAAAVGKFFGEQAVDGLTGLLTGTMSAADAVRNLTAALVRAALQAAILGEGPFAKLMGGGTGIFGALFGFAEGGYTGDGDTYAPAGIVHKGEYVFSKKAVGRIGLNNLDSAHRNALDGFASGSYVGDHPRFNQPAPKAANVNVAQPISISAPITVNGSAGTPEQNADLAKQMRKELEGSMRGVVNDEIRRQLKPGNVLNKRLR